MESLDRNVITVKGYVCNSLTLLSAWHEGYNTYSQLIVSDLSMGVWRANQIATDFFSQLNLYDLPAKKPEASDYAIGTNGFLQFSLIAGEGIDAESLGDNIFKANQTRVYRLLSALADTDAKRLFIVILPTSPDELHSENESFLTVFIAALKATFHELIFIHISGLQHLALSGIEIVWENTGVKVPITPELPNHTLIGILPYVMPANWLSADINIDLLIPVGCNNFIVPLEYRRPLTDIPKLAMDKLAKNYAGVQEITAFAQFNGNSYFIDNKFLCNYAWKQFAQGAKTLGVKFLKKAYSSSNNPLEKATALCQLQGIRIALWQFADVAEEPAPTKGIPDSIRRFLLIAKGWGCVMLGKLETAEACLKEATSTFPDDQMRTKEYLYLLNINALLLFKQGRLDDALTKEKQIELILEQDSIRDYKLKYVNAINIARLYKRLSQFELSLAYFLKAFDTTFGLMQESDLIYYNFIISQANQNLQHWEQSFNYLICAALNWLCAFFPESVSKRLFVALGLPTSANNLNISHEISKHFIEKITLHPYYVQYIANNANEVPANVPRFVSSDNFSGKIEKGIGCKGYSFFVSSKPGVPPEHLLSLSAIVFKVLFCSSKILMQQADVTEIIIDSNRGFDIPRNLEDLLVVAQRLHVNEVFWNNERVVINTNDEKEFDSKTEIALHPGIADLIEKNGVITIVFKRYYSNIIAPQYLYPIIKIISLKPLSLADLSDVLHIKPEDLLNHVAELEEFKIIKLTHYINEYV